MTDKQEPTTETVEEPKATTETVADKQEAKEPKTETAEAPEATIARLERELHKRNTEEAARRKKLEAYETAEQVKADAEKSDLQKEKDRAAALEAENKKLKLEGMRRAAADKVGAAAKTKLPEALVDRLKGETPEELEADAQNLLSQLPKAQPAQSKTDITNAGGAGANMTHEQWMKFLNGQGEMPKP